MIDHNVSLVDKSIVAACVLFHPVVFVSPYLEFALGLLLFLTLPPLLVVDNDFRKSILGDRGH